MDIVTFQHVYLPNLFDMVTAWQNKHPRCPIFCITVIRSGDAYEALVTYMGLSKAQKKWDRENKINEKAK